MLMVQMPLEERFVVQASIQAAHVDGELAAPATAEKIVAKKAKESL